MKSLILIIAVAALIIAGNGFIHNGALAGQGKKIITIETKYSVDKVKTPSFMEKLLCTDRTCKATISCSASSPGEYVKVACTVVSAVYKGFRTAALSGVKFAAKNASKFIRNMVLLGRVLTSI